MNGVQEKDQEKSVLPWGSLAGIVHWRPLLLAQVYRATN